MSEISKNYSTISPSAAWLARLKSHTSIPFAKQAADILFAGDKTPPPVLNEADRIAIFKWMIHFENRYRTVEQLLTGSNPQNILEISSGFSFRALDWCSRLPVHFIDTDLPDVIEQKKTITTQLVANNHIILKGTSYLQPLNALDRDAFLKTIEQLPPGPVSIVNEGLLVYLDDEEKKQLCAVIHHVLQERGGCWITADIYIKTPKEVEQNTVSELTSKFRTDHRIDENRFDDYTTAERFFNTAGFTIAKKLALVADQLSVLNLLGDKKAETIEKLGEMSRARETWCLTVTSR
jgi:hypothetical protein